MNIKIYHKMTEEEFLEVIESVGFKYKPDVITGMYLLIKKWLQMKVGIDNYINNKRGE